MTVKYAEFRQDNTHGYTDAELDALNVEWTARADAMGLHPADDEYDAHLKVFADEIAKR